MVDPDTAEAATPGLRAVVGEILDSEARRLGVWLDAEDVLACRPEGEPEMRITAAADELAHQLAAQPDALADRDALLTLAFAGALAMVTRVEICENR